MMGKFIGIFKSFFNTAIITNYIINKSANKLILPKQRFSKLTIPNHFTIFSVIYAIRVIDNYFFAVEMRHSLSCDASQLCVQWHYIGSMTLALMGVLIQQKLASATKWGFSFCFVRLLRLTRLIKRKVSKAQ